MDINTDSLFHFLRITSFPTPLKRTKGVLSFLSLEFRGFAWCGIAGWVFFFSLCVENSFPLPNGGGREEGLAVKAGEGLTCMCDTVADMSGISDGHPHGG